MTIQNPEAYVAGQWNWGILKGCFGQTKIEPTDIDGFVERKGKFLLLETKAPSVELKDGQRFTYEALWQTRLVTIIIIWGKTNIPEAIEIWTQHKKMPREPADLKRLRSVVTAWFKWADEF